MSDRKELFLSIGLDEKNATNTLKNAALSDTLADLIAKVQLGLAVRFTRVYLLVKIWLLGLISSASVQVQSFSTFFLT